ncbi:MAG: peptidoglycan-binding protein [Christensenellaceae bacterium]
MESSIGSFVTYLKKEAENGSIYVWGAQGESDISESWIKKKETSTENANRAIKLWKKRVNAGYKNIRAFDCSGLGMFYLQNITGAYSGDANANTLMNDKCNKITKRSALKKGDWVFRVNSSGRAYHIGYIVTDDLQVIEAKGRDDGVVKRGIDASGSSYWNAYGRPKIFDIEVDWTVSRLLKKTSPMMRGADVSELQRRLKKAGCDCGEIDGIFGKKTRNAVKAYQRKANLKEDGIAGKNTVTALGGVWIKT